MPDMLFTTIWPIFGLICAGYLLMRRAFPSTEFWSAAERLNYFVLFPALLVSSLANAPVYDPAVLRMGGAAAATIVIASIGLALVLWARPMPAARFGPVLQGVIRFNTYLALALVSMLAGQAGLERAAVFLAVSVPLVNVLSIGALSGAVALRHPMILAGGILRNPLILACLAGIALAVLGTGLPYGTGKFLSLLGQGSLPLGLLCVGAALQPGRLRQDMAGLVWVGAGRLLLMPALATGVIALFGLTGAEAMVMIVFSAVPTAATAYVLTRQMNGDAPFMAGIVTSQTLAVVVTLPVVLFVWSSF